jgi:hypothetical protein
MIFSEGGSPAAEIAAGVEVPGAGSSQRRRQSALEEIADRNRLRQQRLAKKQTDPNGGIHQDIGIRKAPGIPASSVTNFAWCACAS